MKKTGQLTLNIEYPKTAFLTYTLIMKKQGVNYFFPFNDIFTSLDQIKAFSTVYIQQNQDENTVIPAAPVVFPISLTQKFPLKSAYWDEPTEELTKTERINNFLNPLQNHHFHKLLVTPWRSGEKTLFKAAYCFRITAKDAEISFFLSNSFLSMDERIKYAAVYHFGTPFRFELNSGKKITITQHSGPVIH